MVVLAYYLGAVANEFMCKQWERKGMHADVYFYVWRNMGPDTNVLYSCVRISSWHLWSVDSCLCLPSTPDLSPFHVRERTREQAMLSPALFADLHTKTIHCCGTVSPNRKGMPKNFGYKINLKRGDLRLRWKITWQPLHGRANEMQTY